MEEKKKKWIYYVPILLTAVGGPYAAMSGDAKKLLSSFTSPSTQTSADAMPLYGDAAGYANSAVPGGVMPNVPGQAGAVGPGLEGPRLEGPTVQDFRQVIRFDVSPRWVAQYWSRVTTVTSELELEGLRVPLVTGGQPSDLAGSLTYYFNKHHGLQRLTFHGVTGDERRLVAMLITTFGFKEQPALGGGMYVTTWNGKPSSVLRVQYAPIVSSTAPNAQKQITLEINHPGEFQRLSAEMKELVELDQHVRRW